MIQTIFPGLKPGVRLAGEGDHTLPTDRMSTAFYYYTVKANPESLKQGQTYEDYAEWFVMTIASLYDESRIRWLCENTPDWYLQKEVCPPLVPGSVPPLYRQQMEIRVSIAFDKPSDGVLYKLTYANDLLFQIFREE